MIVLAWNARGLGGSRAFRELSRLACEATPDVFFISEARISYFRANVIKDRLKFSNCFCVNPVRCKGGLLLFWNCNINLSILSYSNGHIDSLIDDHPSPFYFKGFYGNPAHNLWCMSWNLLHKVTFIHSKPSLGWLVGGDFNEILFDSKKKG